MLDIVFFEWMRTGSYPPDSNEYEKTLLLNFEDHYKKTAHCPFSSRIFLLILNYIMNLFTYIYNLILNSYLPTVEKYLNFDYIPIDKLMFYGGKSVTALIEF